MANGHPMPYTIGLPPMVFLHQSPQRERGALGVSSLRAATARAAHSLPEVNAKSAVVEAPFRGSTLSTADAGSR